MATTYDAIIIGTGQAGPSLAVRLASSGMRVAILERKQFGGTCVNTGCIPTKTLVASAPAAHVARHAGEYGVMIDGSITVDMKKVKERKDAVVHQSNEGLEKWLKGTEHLTVYQGHARFTGPRLIQREDGDVSEAVRTIVEAEDIKTRLSAECIALEKRGDKVAVGVDCTSGDKIVVGSHVLLAVGRVPNTADLGLENARIAVDQRGYIQVDDQLRTNVPGIYALGDCNGRGAFTHTSYNDYEIVAANLLDGDQRRVSDRITAYNLYIDPPLGRAGMTETEARKSGRKALIAKRPMTRVGRAVEKGETEGVMKILVDAKTKEILGASLLGIECDEVIHSILDVMYAKAPYTVIQRAMHIHPTVTELIPTMLGELKPLE